MLSLPEFSTRFQRVFLFIVCVGTRIHTARVSLSVKTMNQKRKNITMVLSYAWKHRNIFSSWSDYPYFKYSNFFHNHIEDHWWAIKLVLKHMNIPHFVICIMNYSVIISTHTIFYIVLNSIDPQYCILRMLGIRAELR